MAAPAPQKKMKNGVSLKGTDRETLLHSLWFGKLMRGKVQQPAIYQASQAPVVLREGWIDHFSGAEIKADLSQDWVDPSGYDKQVGPGTFAHIVETCRK